MNKENFSPENVGGSGDANADIHNHNADFSDYNMDSDMEEGGLLGTLDNLKLSDDQFVFVLQRSGYDGMLAGKIRMRVGDLRQRLLEIREKEARGEDAIELYNINNDNGSVCINQNFKTSRYIYIEEATPEMIAREQELEKSLKIFKALPSSSIKGSFFNEEGELAFTVEEILDFADKIREYKEQVKSEEGK